MAGRLFEFGAPSFYCLREGEFYPVLVELFEEGGSCLFERQACVDEKNGNYRFADSIWEMKGEEAFKAWSP